MSQSQPFDPIDPPSVDLIIQGGIILTMVEGSRPVEQGCVRIGAGRILSVDQGEIRPAGLKTLDARNGIILPGLVNAHTHTAMTLFRGFADDLPLTLWLFEKIFPAEARFLNPETVYWGTLLGCLEMIASGTTCVSDGYFFQDAAMEAFMKSGLRALVAQGVIDFPAPGIERPEENLLMGRSFLERWAGSSRRVTPGLFCHSPVTCSEKTLRGAMEISREFGVPLQTHLSETTAEVEELVSRTKERPVFYLDHIGVLGDDLIGAHGIHLDEDEIRLLADRGARLVHVPESNMKLASGTARVQDLLDAGVRVGLGTDGCASNNNLDLLEEMDTAAKAAKLFGGDPTHLGAEATLRMATVGGASVLGLDEDIGTLEPGKRADLIVVDVNQPHLQPLYNPYSTLVYSATGADVRHAVVNGKVLMEDRRFTTLDPDEIMSRVNSIAEPIRGG
ncbi:MAG: amidohydrolase family protein [Thermodesulfobacteriota bacterium]